MKEFYLKHANIKENQLKMAKVGYLSRIRELGSQLVSCTVKESYEIAKELAEVVECFRSLEDEYEYNIKMYQEVALKEINKKEEKADA
jgi:hypothetical protein